MKGFGRPKRVSLEETVVPENTNPFNRKYPEKRKKFSIFRGKVEVLSSKTFLCTSHTPDRTVVDLLPACDPRYLEHAVERSDCIDETTLLEY